MSKTIFNWFSDDWKRVKNHCRTTDNKEFTENEATDTFKKKLLISEHTPIRLLEFDWSWKGIYYWLSTEWSRHKFEKFISSQRDDRLIDNIHLPFYNTLLSSSICTLQAFHFVPQLSIDQSYQSFQPYLCTLKYPLKNVSNASCRFSLDILFSPRSL